MNHYYQDTFRAVRAFSFCPICAVPINAPDTQNIQSCGDCGFIHYHNPIPVAVALITHEYVCEPHFTGVAPLLTVRRTIEPQRGHWGLPAGFVNPFETLRQAALREFQEETGCTWNVNLDDVQEISSFCTPGNQLLNFLLFPAIDAGIIENFIANSEADAICWRQPTEDFAFPSHQVMAKVAQRALIDHARRVRVIRPK